MSMYDAPRYEEQIYPAHGDTADCVVCGKKIEYIEETASTGDGRGGYEVLNSWWHHVSHPEDGHDAVFGGPA